MRYVFKGRLCGYLCADCREWLSDVVVRVYQPEGDQILSRATANPKETFQILDADAAGSRTKRLLAEAKTDAEGRFTIELERGYEGGALEIDVYCTTVPQRKPTRREPEPLQFSITTLQPVWRGRDEQFASWEYCIPWRYWCAIRGRFDAWTICGHVNICELKQPLGGVRRISERCRCGSGPAGDLDFTLPPAVPGQQFGTAAPVFNVANLAKCAYVVHLRVYLLLTTGDSAPDPLYDFIAFCK